MYFYTRVKKSLPIIVAFVLNTAIDQLAADIVTASVFNNALLIGRGLVAAVKLCMKQEGINNNHHTFIHPMHQP